VVLGNHGISCDMFRWADRLSTNMGKEQGSMVSGAMNIRVVPPHENVWPNLAMNTDGFAAGYLGR
jgi:hypothetical protein